MAKGAFKKLEGKLAARPGVRNPGALAAFIGDKKYGKKAMESGAKSGKPVSGKQAPMSPPKLGKKGC